MDRLFADYCVIASAVHTGREAVIRCPQKSFGVVPDFWASDSKEQVVILPCPTTPSTRAFVKEHQSADGSASAPDEIHAADRRDRSLADYAVGSSGSYPTAEFYQVYGWRWGSETYYDRLKNIFEVERFSGLSQHAIEQDFYAMVFLTTLESVLTKSAQTTLNERDEQRQTQTEARVNRALSYVSLCDRVVTLLADPRQDLETIRDELHRLFQQTPTRHKPGRQVSA